MRLGKKDGARGSSDDTSRPDRRAFLRVGAGCALPLVAGGVLAGRAGGAAAETGSRGPGQDPVDAVLAEVEQELARTYHAMRGPAGVRGEHVRALAANLELTAACLEGQQVAGRVEAVLRRRLADVGREAVARESLGALGRVTSGLSLQYGIAPHEPPDVARVAAAVDEIAARGLSLNLRGYRARLNRVAAEFDRAEQARGGTPKPLVVRQKPGDDFQGLPEPPVGLTGCQLVRWLVLSINVMAAVLAVSGVETPAAIAALLSTLLDLVAHGVCKDEFEF